jgi:hypothetical protein
MFFCLSVIPFNFFAISRKFFPEEKIKVKREVKHKKNAYRGNHTSSLHALRT